MNAAVTAALARSAHPNHLLNPALERIAILQLNQLA